MSALSDKVTALAKDYLGPAAGVFLQRQTKAHMNGIAFETIEKQHLPDLAKWTYVSGALLIDKEKAKELSDKIAKLA